MEREDFAAFLVCSGLQNANCSSAFDGAGVAEIESTFFQQINSGLRA